MEENSEELQVTRPPSVLPDELVEKIVSMMPFPSVYKARVLAKAWNARLKPTLSQFGASRDLARCFQKQVLERSPQWETFSPVLVAKTDLFFGYHRATHSWKEMPPLPFLPSYMFQAKANFQMEGALVLASKRFAMDSMFVTDLLTGKTKELPPIPRSYKNRSVCSNSSFCVSLVINTVLQTYQVIRFCRACIAPTCIQCHDSLSGSNRKRMCSVQVYDSQTGTWTSRWIALPGQFRCSPGKTAQSVCMDGMIYMSTQDSCDILIYSIEEGAFKRFPRTLGVQVGRRIHFARRFSYSSLITLVVCDHGLLMVIVTNLPKPRLVVKRIDLELQRVSRVGKGHNVHNLGVVLPPVADRNCIYFHVIQSDESVSMITYDLVLLEWKSFRVDSTIMEKMLRNRYERRGEEFPEPFRFVNLFGSTPFHFRPGLAPFVNL